MKNYRIAVAGTGYVGLSIAVLSFSDCVCKQSYYVVTYAQPSQDILKWA